MSSDNSSFKVAAIAQQAPKKIAVVDYFGKNNRTPREKNYADLERGIRAVHALFEFYGIGQGSYIAVVAQNRSEVLEVFFAAFRVGAIPYAVNPNLTDAAMTYMFEELPPDFVFLENEDLDRVQALVEIDIQTQFILFGENLAKSPISTANLQCQSYEVLRASAWNIPALKYESIPQFVMFTSGSTGTPKAILRDFVAPAAMPLEIAGIKVNDDEATFLNTPQVGATPLFHSIGDTLKVVQAGISVTMLRAFDANMYLELIERYQPTFLWLLPSHLNLCLRLKRKWKGKFPRLMLVAVGGGACSENQKREAQDLFNCPVVSFYGLSEGGPQFTFADLDLHTLPANCVGHCGPNSQVKLLDHAGNETDQGELCFHNESLFKGYFGNDELTKEKLKDGWFKTGDLFKSDKQGLFYYQGRVDDMFICGGENIYPLELEKLLLAHPAIEAACVVACDDEISGAVPIAMVVQKPLTDPVSRKELQKYCLENGASVAYPRWISVADILPLSGPGKIDRKKVKALVTESFRAWLENENPKRSTQNIELDADLVNEIKALIQELCELKSISLDDNVFRIGMSSFHVTVFCSRVKEHYGIRITMEDVFRLEYLENVVAKIQQDLDTKKVTNGDSAQNKDTGITL